MFITELDTFVKKFHQLRHDGFTAHLDLDTQAGNAWVGLQVQLGQAPGHTHWQVHPYPQQVHATKESHSRRRSAAKIANINHSKAVEASTGENEEDNTEVVAEKVTEGSEVAENAIEKVSLEGDAVNATIESTLEDVSEEVCPDEKHNNNNCLQNLLQLM